MSDKGPLLHVLRPAPSWSTCEPITVCGNRARDGDLSVAEMVDHIRTHCRGSIKVAYGSCCVTCLDNMPGRWGGSRLKPGVAADTLVAYLSQIGRRQAHRAPVIASELQALEELVTLHRDQFEGLVAVILERRAWREKKAKREAV